MIQQKLTERDKYLEHYLLKKVFLQILDAFRKLQHHIS